MDLGRLLNGTFNYFQLHTLRITQLCLVDSLHDSEHTLGRNSWPCSLDNVHHRKSLSHILAEAASADSCHGQTVPRYLLAFPLNSGLVFSIKTQV